MIGLHLSTPFEIGRALWSSSGHLTKPLSLLRPSHDNTGLTERQDAPRTETTDFSILEEGGVLQLMSEAQTLEQYQKCAERLDNIQRHNDWKIQSSSCEPEYNPAVIEEHIRLLENARNTSDLSAMQHLLRTALSRELGGMNMSRLYKHSWSGTKVLIEDYITCVLNTIERFAESAVAFNLATTEVQFYQQSLEDALKYFGRSALNLSGGGTLGMKHLGVVKTLWEADVLPEIISGASAGSIVAAVVGTCSDEEMRGMLESFPNSDLACFDPSGTGAVGWFRERICTLCYSGTLFQMKNMERVMKSWMGDITFREAYNKTKRVLNICVSSADSEEPRLLNYVTAPNVLIWSAVCASCSVPGVFPSATIYEKDTNTKQQRVWMAHAKQMFVDGSLDHDIPMRKLSEMFNVNFFIVSQVNPHVRLFLDSEEDFRGTQVQHSASNWPSLSRVCNMVKNVAGQEVLHVAQQLRNCGINPPQLRWASILSQQYTGDINVLPAISVKEVFSLLTNPTPEFMRAASRDGERATWPKVYRIKNCVAIELGLIRAIHTLRERVNFGPEAKAAREAGQRAGRGRSYSIKGQRPGFLRGRSLSNEHVETRKKGLETVATDGVSSPARPLNLRRNQSLGAINDKLLIPSIMSQNGTPVTSPSPGFFAGGLLTMTSVVYDDKDQYFVTECDAKSSVSGFDGEQEISSY